MAAKTPPRQSTEDEHLTPKQRYTAVMCTLDWLANLLHSVFTGTGIPQGEERYFQQYAMAKAVPMCREAQQEIRLLCEALGMSEKDMLLPPPIDITHKAKTTTPKEDCPIDMTIEEFLGTTGLTILAIKEDLDRCMAETNRRLAVLKNAATKARLGRKRMKSII